ncbi:homoserine kinase [Labedella gwakjiensis]|uniref:Homoserine kinase n=1 Tax=Labedella gwakjiensis TaxID=390269 RepID=A0A2P8GY86_9MICO|nr:homoserine kinase [Labedella gwakjiensis]PSL38937.1 homoserine kinase [Labedella gwakjiensis]RUQ86601.1 homoserine kinase [Labedella gwakjiensis]
MSLVGRRVAVRVPATTANLGPGFDTLGLALSVYDELVVEAVDRPGVRVTVEGVGAGQVPTDETNLVASSLLYALKAMGIDEVPGLDLRARNTIPHGRGMGSSGAAVVSGIVAAKGLLEGTVDVDDETLLRLATEIEGHPDNVAPALFGGLAIAWTTSSGPAQKTLLVHRSVSPLILVPETTLSTKVARGLQPEHVPHEDAVFNVSRSALLIAALTQSPELLFAATEDKLHQSYRASAMPETASAVALLREHGLPAVVSGAGPSVLVLANGAGERLEAADLIARHAGSHWAPLMLAVDVKGATVELIPGDTV